MRPILKFLKPSALAGMLLLLILLMQGVFFSYRSVTFSIGGDKPVATQSSFGVGTPITLTTVNGVTNRDIKWPILLTNLAASYLLAVVLDRALARATRFRRPAATFATIAILVIVVSFLLSIGLSRSYWGYFFTRPPVLNEVSDVASVVAVFPITTVVDDDGARRIMVQKDYPISDTVGWVSKDEYYFLQGRLLLAFDEAGMIPSSHSTEMADLPELYPLIQKTGILAAPKDGYNDSDLFTGVLIDGLNHAGNRLVFIGATGRQVSNDHYPYYEMVFTGNAGSSALSYVRGQRFFYDVAGLEGVEWYSVLPFFAAAGLVIAFVVTAPLMLIWRLVRRPQKSQQNEPPLSSALE